VARPGFVWAFPKGFRSTSRTGKWCVNGDAERIDQLWVQVRQAIQDKTLVAGCASTAAQAAGHGGSYVVCAFTLDWLDFEDLRATRELLRSWGVSEEIGYKRDIETIRNVYSGPDEWIYRA
jgi:hypothetical protein